MLVAAGATVEVKDDERKTTSIILESKQIYHEKTDWILNRRLISFFEG